MEKTFNPVIARPNNTEMYIVSTPEWLSRDFLCLTGGAKMETKDHLIQTIFFSIVMSALFILMSLSCARAEEINMDKIKMIESSGNPKAWNKTDDSRGLYQITPIVLKEWNNFHPTQIHTSSDLWSPSVNLKIADWYMNKRIPQMLKHFGVEDTIQNRIISYNAGISYVIKKKLLPPITVSYLRKYGVK